MGSLQFLSFIILLLMMMVMTMILMKKTLVRRCGSLRRGEGEVRRVMWCGSKHLDEFLGFFVDCFLVMVVRVV